MITFRDGPAGAAIPKVTLDLGRVPIMLRVVRNADCEWDALDLTQDTAAADEEIHVYRLATEPSRYHVLIRGGRDRRSGWRWRAEYEYIDPQPADADIRSNAAWGRWCRENRERLLEQAQPGIADIARGAAPREETLP